MNHDARPVVDVPAGEHLFMSWTAPGVTHFLGADVDAAKRCFTLVRWMYGGGLQLRPIRPQGTSDHDMSNPDFLDWLRATEEKPAWPQQIRDLRRRYAKIAEGQAHDWKHWLRKSADERAQLALRRAGGL